MNLVALVLAAGAGRRFGGSKMSASFRGEPLIRHAIRAARAAPVARVVVVCPAGLDIGAWPGSPPVSALPVASDALSASLKAGMSAAAGADGAFVFLGDMPLVPHAVAAHLANVLDGNFAALPRYDGRPGHPVLLSARAFAMLDLLDGDRGAGALLKDRADIVFADGWPESILLDVDRVEDIGRLEARDSH